MSSSPGWLRQLATTRIGVKKTDRTHHLRHLLRLSRHGKLSWWPPTPAPICFCKSFKNATKAKATKGIKVKGSSTISLSFLPLTSSLQISRSLSPTVPRPQTPMISSWTLTSILNVSMSGLRTTSSSLLFSSRTKQLIGISNTKIPKEVE